MKYRIYRLESKIGFGKHNGKTIAEIIDSDPEYLAWCIDNLDWFCLDKEAELLLDIELDWQEEFE